MTIFKSVSRSIMQYWWRLSITNTSLPDISLYLTRYSKGALLNSTLPKGDRIKVFIFAVSSGCVTVVQSLWYLRSLSQIHFHSKASKIKLTIRTKKIAQPGALFHSSLIKKKTPKHYWSKFLLSFQNSLKYKDSSPFLPHKLIYLSWFVVQLLQKITVFKIKKIIFLNRIGRNDFIFHGSCADIFNIFGRSSK